MEGLGFEILKEESEEFGLDLSKKTSKDRHGITREVPKTDLIQRSLFLHPLSGTQRYARKTQNTSTSHPLFPIVYEFIEWVLTLGF